ncbi:actin family protein [Kipferlia bialata]|uniref:Actin family protein n=1 Tax=Kipferlia bialata TaxID=797122 RepID=A0A9K3GFQ8_9EUKA|nr:actin family protein [Kipferlia bialata]|eukprot:g2165.t1
MILIWEHTFQKLGIKTEEHSIVLTEAALNPAGNRAKMVKIMFERFKFRAVYVGAQAVLSLYSIGRTNGCVVDSGDGVTHVVPVVHNQILVEGVKRVDVAGRDVTHSLINLLTRAGYTFSSSEELEWARKLKEDLCYVAHDPAEDHKLATQTTTLLASVKLPNGKRVTMGRERYEAPECLFQPPDIGRDVPGVGETVYAAVESCPLDARGELFGNVILSGGTSMLSGYKSRLERELVLQFRQRVEANLQGSTHASHADKAVANFSKKILKIIARPERRFQVYCGARAFVEICVSNTALGESMFVTMDGYTEDPEASLAKLRQI